jgi:hypothetical protein
MSRMVEFWRSGGALYGGNRNLYGVFGWNRSPSFGDYLYKYRRQNIAKRIINAPADALWADPPLIVGDATFDAAWADLLQHIPVFANFQRVDKLARIGRYSVLLIGFDDGGVLDQPLKTRPGRKIMYMQPYSEESAKIHSYVGDITSPRFGQPEFYEITPGKVDQSQGGSQLTSDGAMLGRTFRVHHTRVLHVAEGALESQVFGVPALEAVYNDLDDLQKVTGGAAELFWLAGNRGMHINIDKEMELDPEDEEALSAELDEYQHELRRTIRTRGVEVNPLGSEVADPRGVFTMMISVIAATTGIPQRMLTGSEAGQLASQQDRANWAQRLAERISEFGGPVMLLPFLRMCIHAGVLPEPTTLKVTWPDAFKMNPLERAQTSAQMARSAANLSKTLETIANMNITNAQASQPEEVPIGMGGGFGANADEPAKSAKPAAKPAAGKPQTMTKPAILKEPPPTVVFLTEEECRNIIGFGKQAPVFDSDATEVPSAVKSVEE